MKKLLISLTLLISALALNSHSFAAGIDKSSGVGTACYPANCEPGPAPRDPE